MTFGATQAPKTATRVNESSRFRIHHPFSGHGEPAPHPRKDANIPIRHIAVIDQPGFGPIH